MLVHVVKQNNSKSEQPESNYSNEVFERTPPKIFPEITHQQNRETAMTNETDTQRRNMKRYIAMQKVYNERVSAML